VDFFIFLFKINKKILNKKMKDINFKNYIPKVLNQIHPDAQISANVKNLVNSLLNNLGNKIANEAVFLAAHCGGKTVTRRAMTSSVRLTLTPEIGKHAMSEGLKACSAYINSKPGTTRKSTTAAKRSRLIFPPARARKLIENNAQKGIKISQLACVYLAAVLEYLTAEILELSGNAARNDRKSTISSKHLQLAVRHDNELAIILKDVTIPGGGVLSNIHAVLLKKKPKKKKKKKKSPKKK